MSGGIDRDSVARLRAALSNPTVLTVLIALLGALVVFLIATEVFPYHSNNDDEAVYLQQAAMLLEGQLRMTTAIPAAFRPWFFVMEETAIYPKYSPVPAAIFALGMAIGLPRLSLAAVAAGIVILVSLLTAEAFDRRTGVLAAAFLVATPLFLLNSSVFLPYAPTTLFNLLFALAYVRAIRRRSLAYGALAGTASGLAFFARPYTAVLFAVPFIVHACYRLAATLWVRDGRGLRRESRRYGILALFGLALVGVALWYNRLLTGSALVFPYQEFAPRDGLGFGYRELLIYSREYTPETAVLANWQVVFEFATRWTVAAPIGTILAAIGVAVHLRSLALLGRLRRFGSTVRTRTARALTTERSTVASDGGPRTGRGSLAWVCSLSTDRFRKRRDSGRPSQARAVIDRFARSVRSSLARSYRSFEDGSGSAEAGLSDETVRSLLVGLFVSVIVGNVYFWGNLNMLAGLYNPTDGFISLYGPFYHLDLLAPLSAFGAVGLLVSVRRLRRSLAGRLTSEQARTIALAVLLILVPVGATAQVNTLDSPLSGHLNNTEQYEQAYAPFENRGFENALVFLPPIFGEWLSHPFQPLRNDPSLRGPVVYALSRSTGADFTVIDAYENRTLYRYAFRGLWGTANDQPVQPRLQRLRVANGTRHRITTDLGIPNQSTAATVRLEAGRGAGLNATQYTVNDRRLDRLQARNQSLSIDWVLAPQQARIAGSGLTPVTENRTVALDPSQPTSFEVTFLQPGGGTITYHYELSVSADERSDSVQVIWPPRTEICRLTADCGTEGTYLPGLGGYPAGTAVNTTIETRG